MIEPYDPQYTDAAQLGACHGLFVNQTANQAIAGRVHLTLSELSL